MLETNRIINGTYRIIKEIGRGGTGVIYIAQHLHLRKYVVLKRIDIKNATVEQLRRETDVLKNLRYTFLPQIYDYIVDGNQVFTVMDYIDGCDFTRLPAGGNRIPENDLLKWLRQMAGTLEYLGKHKPPVIHSDIKPGNIILQKNGDICLIDFNISIAENSTGKVIGFSQNFAAPEQVQMAASVTRGQPVTFRLDSRADIYSTGATFYYLISGQKPDCYHPVMPLTKMKGLRYSPGLLAIIDRCMAWNRDARYRSGTELLKALDDILKQDERYKKYVLLRAASWVGSGMLIAAGVFSLLRGREALAGEHFTNDYKILISEAESGDHDEAESLSFSILNNAEYKGILRESSEHLANIYHILGDAAYDRHDYAGAVRYYREALTAAKESDLNCENYYRDLCISYAYSGDTAAAEVVSAEAEANGVGSASILLVDASIALEKQEIETCIEDVTELLRMTSDVDILGRGCRIAAEAAILKNDNREAASWLEQAGVYSSDPAIREQLGSVYITLANETNWKTDRDAWIQKALTCYESLTSGVYASFENRMNLAIVYRMQGRYSESLTTLQSCAEEKPDDYQVNMYMAFDYYESGDASNAGYYTNKAISIYDKLSDTEKQNTDPEAVEALRVLQRRLLEGGL